MPIFRLPDNEIVFPNPALAEPEGILAIGGDLSPERLLLAYSIGLFPWFNYGEEIAWWTPDPRLVLFPNELIISHSLRPYFNQKKYTVTFDKDFLNVILGCKHNERKGQLGTWISTDIIEAYYKLHEMGFAHSVEVWNSEGALAGGLYGISLGKVFFGESMFANESNASKIGFITLVQALAKKDFRLVDCQQDTPHLRSMGARIIPRKKFQQYLHENESEPTLKGNWGVLL